MTDYRRMGRSKMGKKAGLEKRTNSIQKRSRRTGKQKDYSLVLGKKKQQRGKVRKKGDIMGGEKRRTFEYK